MSLPPEQSSSARQPLFNLPSAIIGLAIAMGLLHLIRVSFLDFGQETWVIANFAFFPAQPEEPLPWGDLLGGARVWSFVTYSFLHADWGHLIVNMLWMAAFGSPLAWRFGFWRFLAFSALAAIAGAAVHLAAHAGEVIPLVGASAAVSAHMAGAARFLFIAPRGAPRSYRAPAAPLSAVLSDQRTLIFLGIWVVINLGIGLFGFASEDIGRIAWEAHLGGFAVGLLLFRLFDPIPMSAEKPV